MAMMRLKEPLGRRMPRPMGSPLTRMGCLRCKYRSMPRERVGGQHLRGPRKTGTGPLAELALF